MNETLLVYFFHFWTAFHDNTIILFFLSLSRSVDELDDLLSNSDYVVNILPSTRNTRGLLDNNKLELCKNRRSVFMNVGRGDICTEESILNALQ